MITNQEKQMFCNSKPGRSITPEKFGIVLLLAAFMLQATTQAQSPPPAARWIPAGAVISMELSQPKALLDLVAGKEATAAITASPIYRSQAAKPKFNELLNMITFLETTLDTDWRTGLVKLTGGGITLAVCPQDTVLLIIDAEDQTMLNRLHEVFLGIARSEAEKKGQADRVASTEYKDVTVWTFDGKEAHAIIGSRLVIANHPEGLRTVLELRDKAPRAPGGDQSETLTSNAAYRAAKQAVGPDAVAAAFVNLKPLLQLPNVAQLLEKQRGNPLAALAFAGIVEALRDSSRLALGLNIEDTTLVLRALVDGKAAGPTNPAAFALPSKKDDGALPNLSVPRRIAALSVYRDLYQFYAAKDDLFPERTSGLIFFENMMGIFFSGRDLTNEVLAQTKPEIRLVVAEQEYDPAIGAPQVKLPAFAAILRLRNPQQFDVVMEEAWQKAVGLINFTRGQKAMPGLIIDRPIQGETKFTVAYFSSAEAEDKTRLDQRFNFRPAIAMPGEYLVFSSTDGLARDLIDALGREIERPPKPLAETHSLVEIDAEQLASILKANRQTLVRGDMVKKGRTAEESEAGIDMLIGLAECVEHVKLSIGREGELTLARLEARLNIQ
jgi:hypothetical protein